MPRLKVNCYCAFCRSTRSVYAKKHVSFVDVSLTLVASGLLSLIIWQDFDPRALAFFPIGLGLSETFVILRRRFSMPCRSCGFDPILYKKDPGAAALRVKEYMAAHRENPLSAFVAPPRLPVIVKKAANNRLVPPPRTR